MTKDSKMDRKIQLCEIEFTQLDSVYQLNSQFDRQFIVKTNPFVSLDAQVC